MKYFIVDGFNLAYRAHNVNFDLKTASGLYSGMMFGFIRTLFSLKKKFRGHKFVVVWDNKPQHKYDLNPYYKAGRSSLPGEVMCQVDDIKDFLRNLGVDQYHMAGQEADDVIATLVEKFRDSAESIIVYSNDKDMLQLVETGKVVVYKPKVGNSPEKYYDEGAVLEQFGVHPKYLACFRSFDGDNSDNLKGIPRVPRKLIASMVTQYKTIGGVYEGLQNQKLTPFQKKAFEEGKERVRTNLKIMTLNRGLDPISCDRSQIQKDKIEEILSKYQIRSIKVDLLIDIFNSALNIRYSDPRPAVKVESYSLFD